MTPKSTPKYGLLALTILMGLGMAFALPRFAQAQRNADNDPSIKHPLDEISWGNDETLRTRSHQGSKTAPNAPLLQSTT